MRDRLVRHYSTGMKQRLGIAITLLGEPDPLVLDEPTNGLDPAGIHEVRRLLRDLQRRRAVTVFLSSHLLQCWSFSGHDTPYQITSTTFATEPSCLCSAINPFAVESTSCQQMCNVVTSRLGRC
jgi:ABC-type antimicrobial peptide transport system ATPase subunit